MIEEYILKR